MYGNHDVEAILKTKKASEYEILIVDDIPENLKVLSQMLSQEKYRVRSATNGEMALKSIKCKEPDLILLDINMPKMDGFELSRILMKDEIHNEIPIIFITALDSLEDKVKGFNHGAVDFITKPFLIEEVKARVKTHLKNNNMRKMLEVKNHELHELVVEKANEVVRSHLSMVYAMVELAETRDDDTGKHIQRIQIFCQRLAELAQQTGLYPEINDAFIKHIYTASPLHDIGKIGIKDNILLKPGKLTEDEFEVMKTHVTIGADKLDSINKNAELNDFVKMGASIARHHHERWNGEGYMKGLKEEEIPIEARIMSIADVYDALRSIRVYKNAYSHKKTLEIMTDMRGKHFDPHLLELFMKDNLWFNTKFIEMSEDDES